ncbi:hypothetical protein OGAPHI_000930 [Ogataea philodendri]|uniref:Respiratory growth induced protein 1 n=1 Tax=Ogataea philodendri TaxID=1378263 RepID=A0A9P8T9L7_9ASCO|nr:uncharacterized protein OGAPHI_000930 [Ogataea philodendri]KAH3670415.1 hypothetical protein OGAPHI_000930 [Ogataea philodendri]
MTKKHSKIIETAPSHLEHLSPPSSRRGSVEGPEETPVKTFDDLLAFEQDLAHETWDNEYDNFRLELRYLPPFILSSIHNNLEQIKPTMNSRSKKFVRHLNHHIKRHLLTEINHYSGVDYHFDKAVVEHMPDGKVLFHLHDYSDHGYGEEADKFHRRWTLDLDVICNPENPHKDGGDERPVGGVKAATRGDVHQPDNSTLARGHQTPTALHEVVHDGEGETGHRGGDLRVGHDVAGSRVDCQQRSRVEAQPRAPDHRHTDKRGDHVLRLVVVVRGWVFPVLSLAHKQRKGQRSNTGSNVHRSSASKVQCAQVVQPAVAGPCGVCERTVAHRAPDEANHQRRHNACTLSNGSDENLHGCNWEKRREGEVDDGRNGSAFNKRAGAQLGKRTKREVAANVRWRHRNGQRVAKQKPLDRDGARDHVRLEQHLDDVLLLEHSSIEKANGRGQDHDSHGTEHHVAHVCGDEGGRFAGEVVERVALGGHQQLGRGEP